MQYLSDFLFQHPDNIFFLICVALTIFFAIGSIVFAKPSSAQDSETKSSGLNRRLFLFLTVLTSCGGLMTIADSYPVWQESMEQALIIGQNKEGAPNSKTSRRYTLQVMLMNEEYSIHTITVHKDFFYECPTGSSLSKIAQSFSFVCETKDNEE